MDCQKEIQVLDKAVNLAEDMIEQPDAKKVAELVKVAEETLPYLMESEKIRVQDAIFHLRHPRIIGQPSDSELIGSAARIERQIILPLFITSFRCGKRL